MPRRDRTYGTEHVISNSDLVNHTSTYQYLRRGFYEHSNLCGMVASQRGTEHSHVMAS